MKNAEKNSWTNNNTLLLCFFLLVAAISVIAYYFINGPKADLARDISWVNDESGLSKNEWISDKNIASKIEVANNKMKRCREKLLLGNELSSEEKVAYGNILGSINDYVLGLDEWKLMEISDEEKKQGVIYQVLKESRRLERLELKIDPKLMKRVVDFYYREQPRWWKNTFPGEEKKVIKKIDEVFSPFFHRFREELIKGGEEKMALEEIEPRVVGGEQTTTANLQKHVNFLKSQQYSIVIKETGKDVLVKPRPLELKFSGFTGFLGENEKDEGKITLGMTYCRGKALLNTEKNNEEDFRAWCHPVNGFADTEIKLKKELLFSRLGENYDRWVSDLKEEESGPQYTYSDVSPETLIETIAHELAHAVINSVRWEYKSADGEGHGPLHSSYTKRIREMIESSSEYKEFERWWKEKW